MSLDHKKFPSLKKVNKAIAKFKAVGFPEYQSNDTVDGYIKKIHSLITEELEYFPNLLSVHEEDNDLDLIIYRVRPLDSIQNINLFSQHSYPPSNVTPFGRCNFPQFPVFYGANNPMTALLEVARESGGENKKYCISKWKVNPGIKLVLQSFMQMSLPEGSDYKIFQEIQRKRVNEPFQNKLTDDQCDGLLRLLQFLDESFINDKDFALSASLAHRIFYPPHNLKTDILVYPSVQSRFAGLNFAVHPNFVDNEIRVERFYIMELNSYDPNTSKIDVSISNYKEIKPNEGLWKNVKPNDANYLRIIKEDFGDLLESDDDFNFEKI